MPLRPLYGPLRPDLDKFLHAAVGEERDGVPLTMISALARLDLDPWEEAGRLSSLAKPDAGAQLAQTIMRLTGTRWPFPEARRIADGLIELLPTRAQVREAADGSRTRLPRIAAGKIAPGKMFWLLCLLVVVAALVSMVASGDLHFGNRAASEPIQTASPDNSQPPLR
jgi:hypothetical protein